VTLDPALFELVAENRLVQKNYSLKQGWNEVMQVVLDISVCEFYQHFIAQKATFSLVHLEQILGHTNVKNTPWKKNIMVINSIVPVSGVPFISQTNCIKTV